MKRLLCLTLLSALTAPLLAVAAAADKPNVLFIAIDDLRPELGCYGTPVVQSPNIDRLAKSGMVFNNAYCQQAVCLPSRASLLTGARPDSTKAWDLSTDFRKALPDIVTLPQLFKNHGYFSQGMGKLYHHGYDDKASWSTPTVFPTVSHSAGNNQINPDGPREKLSGKGRGPAAEKVIGPDNSLHDGQLGDMAVRTIRELKGKGQPFFLAVGFIRPHLPFNAQRAAYPAPPPGDALESFPSARLVALAAGAALARTVAGFRRPRPARPAGLGFRQ